METFVLKAFDKKDNSTNKTSEEEALHLLSQLTNPAAVRDEDTSKPVYDLTLLHHACYNGWYDVAKVLIEKYGCDPNYKSSIDSTPLHYAYRSGNVEIIDYLISNMGCDPLQVTNNGLTRLHYTSAGGHLKIVKCLIEKEKCDPNSNKGQTPLHVACENGELDVAKYLIEEQKCDPSCKIVDGCTPLHSACQNGHLEIAKYLIEKQQCNPGCKKIDGWTPLHSACAKGHLKVAKYLINGQQCDPSCTKKGGWTPLHLACKIGHLDIAKYLIEEQECDPSCKIVDGCTPLLLVCLNGHLDIAKYLIEEQECDPSCKIVDGWTPLLLACLNGHLEIAKYLIEKQQCDPSCKKRDGWTPLHLACKIGHLEIAKYLIEEQECNPSCKKNDGWTPLLLACQNGHLEIAKYLIEKQQCNPSCKKKDGWTPLLLACLNGHLEITKYLIEKQQCDPSCTTINGLTPLYLACANGHLDVAKYLIEEQQCDLSCTNKNGLSPLHSSCLNRHLEMAKYLIEEMHLDPECTSKNGFTPLHCACHRGYLEIAKYLLEEQKCDPDRRNHFSSTCFSLALENNHSHVVLFLIDFVCDNYPLHEAVDSALTLVHKMSVIGNLEILKYLVELWHCNPDCRDNEGRTPLHLASKHGNFDVVKYLVVKQKCDIHRKTNDGLFPSSLAIANNHDNIVLFLLKHEYKVSTDKYMIHSACKLGHIDNVRFLVKHLNPRVRDSNGLAALHIACENGHSDIVRFLIQEVDCDPMCMTSNAWTPLLSATQYGHLDIIKYLVKECKGDPERGTLDGVTPLNLAIKHGHLEVVLYLVNECLQDISVSPTSNSVLHEAIKSGDDNIVLVLLSYGFKFSTNASQASLLSSSLVQPALKVCVLGNSESGKSTLVKALMSNLVEGSWFNSILYPRVTGVEPHTAGIIPYHAHSPKCGRFILYDFAGQYEHYSSSHAAILENLRCADGDLVFIVVDISKSKEQIVQELQYWDSFVSNQCGQELEKPTVIVIGSHLDVARSQGEQTLSQALCELPHLNISITLDCTRKSSPGLTEVGAYISTHSKQRQTQFSISAQAHFLNRLIQDEFKDKVACQLHEISTAIAHESNDELIRNSLLPSEIDSLSKQLSNLSEYGHILYFKDSKDLSHSWIVLKKEMLLSELNGSIFAPKEFKSVHKDLSSTGVVALSEVKQNFPRYDHQMLMSFMKLLDFCHQIDESEISLIIGERPQTEQSECSVTSAVHINESEIIKEVYYFFPALVSTERPISNCQTILDKCYKFGWCLLCKRNMLTSRFLHVLLLRLAFRYALPNTSPPSEDTTLRVERRQCNVWKNGIHWQNDDGVETIVEVVEQNTAVILLMGCLEGSEIKYLQLRSAIIECILSTKKQYSEAVDSEECFLHPKELTQYPLNNVKDLYNFPFHTLSNAIVKRKNALTNKIGRRQEMITIDELFHFEPYTCLSEELISLLIENSDTDEEVSDDFLRNCARVAHPKVALLKKIFLSPEQDCEYNTALMSPRDQYSDDPTHKSFLIFITWKKFKENPSYKEFRNVLDSYSVFSGRSALMSEL